jgi:hypothetical protein
LKEVGEELENSPRENWGITFSRLKQLNADAVASTHIVFRRVRYALPATLLAAIRLRIDQTIS